LTKEAFVGILSLVKVFTPFLDHVHAFGQKTDEDQITNDTFCQYVAESEEIGAESRCYGMSMSGKTAGNRDSVSNNSTEVCYNLRYVEKNGRNRGDPWSLRQTGVYQKFNMNTGTSTWIILQPSAYTLGRLGAVLEETVTKRSGICFDPLHMHATFFSAARREWADYIESLKLLLRSLVQKRSHLKDLPP
jgi:hypothetical protein